MKNTDVRIGNAVRYDEAVHRFGGQETEIGVKCCEDMDFYNPIDLNKDELLRLGFKEFLSSVKGSVYRTKDNDFLIGNEAGRFYYGVWEVDNDGNFYVEEVKELKYVHKVQNLYYELNDKELIYNKK